LKKKKKTQKQKKKKQVTEKKKKKKNQTNHKKKKKDTVTRTETTSYIEESRATKPTFPKGKTTLKHAYQLVSFKH